MGDAALGVLPIGTWSGNGDQTVAALRPCVHVAMAASCGAASAAAFCLAARRVFLAQEGPAGSGA